MTAKSTVEEIRTRFDNDVERFSNLDTGHQSMPCSPQMLDLIAEAASVVTPDARDVLDIGCGAGNYSLKLLQRLPDLNITLVDLSRPMLDRAEQRVGSATSGQIESLQGDIRNLDLGDARFDIVLAAAVLHHLRSDDEWVAVFKKVHHCLRPGGSFWVSDMVEQSHPAVWASVKQHFGDYLVSLRDEAYRDHVFAYIEKEDTPRPLMYQLDLMRQVGFTDVDILHKHGIGAAFGGVKAR
jgi:tRNA (cmo5U34)-methyltransferase